MELEWLKKKLPEAVEAKRMLSEPHHPELSIRRQCELVGLNRATYYYTPASETPWNLALMQELDQQYLQTPFYSYRRMTVHLQRRGYTVNPKRMRRLMRLLGLATVGPRPRTTQATPENQICPYLLRDLEITQPNQV